MSANASAFSTSKLSNFRTHECPISPKTSWLFLEVVAEDGSTGVGEISHFGVERGVMQMLPGMIGALMGLSITEAICALSARQRRMVAEVPRILLSGIEQALLDLQAKGGVRGGSEWIGLERLLLRLSGLSQMKLMSQDRQEFLL